MKNKIPPKRTNKTAATLTLICVAANIPLLIFIIFGPKEGMGELGILFPWLLTGFVNITLVIPAVLFAKYSGTNKTNFFIKN
ncbi:MAG: hypothetical protein H6681_06600 [Desulfobacteraceae bacterium]|nr:hypothetical protein [Desulfobacteraceae bacterium]MCB9495093.1 hypothetical protein [Desulfobacteraceae bacterium]